MKEFLKVILHPVPAPEGVDTGLRFTDVLFGFVIRELFIRIQNQNWTHFPDAVQLQLIVGTTLVLGSWIGFRGSLHRSSYKLKFFNLPLFRFLVDQLMLVLYFRIAVLTPEPGVNKSIPAPSELTKDTAQFVMLVFFLYVVWDLLGIWMAKAKVKTVDDGVKPRYPELDKDDNMTNNEQLVNWSGTLITVGCLLFLGVLWLLADCLSSFPILLTTTVVLLAYRWCKEIRTSHLS